ncbi:uncharacterized protein BKA78DRAFT_142316 [Phyllosticta capitalensis]|uniref:uncharacterized protein n=1 Tax=Phyllosticta capitalensis TaxID=121624 RepID=UPI0031307EF8
MPALLPLLWDFASPLGGALASKKRLVTSKPDCLRFDRRFHHQQSQRSSPFFWALFPLGRSAGFEKSTYQTVSTTNIASAPPPTLELGFPLGRSAGLKKYTYEKKTPPPGKAATLFSLFRIMLTCSPPSLRVQSPVS